MKLGDTVYWIERTVCDNSESFSMILGYRCSSVLLRERHGILESVYEGKARVSFGLFKKATVSMKHLYGSWREATASLAAIGPEESK